MSEILPDIDDLFKKAIDQHEDTPSPKVWDAIDKNLDKRKVVSISRKYNKLKWAAAILLLCSFGMAMYVWQTNLKNKELVKQNKINKASASKKAITNNSEKTPTVPEIKPNDTSTQQQNILEVQNKTYRQNTAQQNATNNASTTKEKASPLKNSKLKINIQQSTQLQQLMNDPHVTRPEIINRQNIKSNEILNTDKKVNADEIYTSPGYITQAPLLFNRQLELYGITQVPATIPFTKSLTPVEKNIPIENSLEKDPGNNKRNTSVKKNRLTTSKVSPFSATVFYSPEFVSTNVKDDHPRYREDDRHEIKNSENTRNSSSYGILIGYAPGDNVQLQTGLSLFTRVTDITPKTIYARPDNGGKVNYRLSCSAGSAYVPLKSGANPAQGDSTKILSAKNTLQYVSIPLSVKYSTGKGKLKLVIGVGISANILSKGTMESVIATAGGYENSSTNTIEGLKSNYFSSQVNIGAEYHLSKKISLSLSPSGKFALSSINKDAAVKTKLNSFGVSAGITLKL